MLIYAVISLIYNLTTLNELLVLRKIAVRSVYRTSVSESSGPTVVTPNRNKALRWSLFQVTLQECVTRQKENEIIRSFVQVREISASASSTQGVHKIFSMF